MNMIKKQNGTSMTIALEGRLDTMTAPELENEVRMIPDDVSELTLDLENLEYISSAGLRVLLTAHKLMADKGKMKITHVNETVQEVLEVTGFSDILEVI